MNKISEFYDPRSTKKDVLAWKDTIHSLTARVEKELGDCKAIKDDLTEKSVIKKDSSGTDVLITYFIYRL